MDIFEAFATDSKAEIDGRELKLSKTAKLIVARSGNDRHAEAIRKAVEAGKIDLNDSSAASNEVAEEVMIDIMAETILLGWEGLAYQGKSVDYSPEMARTMLRIKDFRTKVTQFASNFENYKLKGEAAQGNA